MELIRSAPWRRVAARHLLLASLAAGLGIAACNAVAGLEELTFTAGSGAAGGSQQGGGGSSATCEPDTDTCSECTYDECRADFCDCMAAESCQLVYDCAEACAPYDTSCERNCMQQYPDQISLALLLLDCASSRCTSCPPSVPLTHCEECLLRQCPEPMNECLSDTTCLDYMLCYFDCAGAPTCIEDCGTAYPGATELFSPVVLCGQLSCYTPCG